MLAKSLFAPVLCQFVRRPATTAEKHSSNSQVVTIFPLKTKFSEEGVSVEGEGLIVLSNARSSLALRAKDLCSQRQPTAKRITVYPIELAIPPIVTKVVIRDTKARKEYRIYIYIYNWKKKKREILRK